MSVCGYVVHFWHFWRAAEDSCNQYLAYFRTISFDFFTISREDKWYIPVVNATYPNFQSIDIYTGLAWIVNIKM